MAWWKQLTTIDHPDPHMRRRGRLLALVYLAVIALAVISLPMSLASGVTVYVAGVIVVSVAIFTTGLLLTRRGVVTGATWLFLLGFSGGILASVVTGSPLVALFFLVLGVITASLVLPPSQIWWVLLLMLGCNVLVLAFQPNILNDQANQMTLTSVAMLLIIATVLSYLGAQAIQQALGTAEANAQTASAAQAHAEEQARNLAVQAETLRRTEQQLHNLVATLETPTVALADNVLLAPLIGVIDTHRAHKLTERLLHDVADQRVQLLILDAAGVPVIDTAVAHKLMQITQGVRLLGCQVVLTGVGPAVAMALTNLGVDLSAIETARSPQEVLTSLATQM